MIFFLVKDTIFCTAFFDFKNSFGLFGLKRKSDVFCPIEGFFELHPPAERAGSRATEGKKDSAEGKSQLFGFWMRSQLARCVKKSDFCLLASRQAGFSQLKKSK